MTSHLHPRFLLRQTGAETGFLHLSQVPAAANCDRSWGFSAAASFTTRQAPPERCLMAQARWSRLSSESRTKVLMMLCGLMSFKLHESRRYIRMLHDAHTYTSMYICFLYIYINIDFHFRIQNVHFVFSPKTYLGKT